MSDEQIVELPDLKDGVLVEQINKADLHPLFDGNHKHVYARDEEETESYYAEVCTVKGCMMGRLVAKS